MNKCNVQGIMWWATLVVAVLAVPAIGLIVSSMFPMGDFAKVIVFVVACWIATWLGMRLMAKCQKSGSTPEEKK